MDGLEDYAFVSIFVAHAADGTIERAEREAIHRNLHRAGGSLGFSDQFVHAVLERAEWQYWDLLEQGRKHVVARFERAVQSLHDAFPDSEVLSSIHEDLAAVAAADGRVDDMEGFLLGRVRRQWQRLQQ